jgi:hypothetical protein
MDFLTSVVSMEIERESMVNVIINSHKNTMDLIKQCDNEFKVLYDSLSDEQKQAMAKVMELRHKMVNLTKTLKQQEAIIEKERIRVMAKKIEPVSKKQKR